jgi:hypothetical protein
MTKNDETNVKMAMIVALQQKPTWEQFNHCVGHASP